MRVPLQMTLTTNFRFGTLGEKRRMLSDSGQLMAIRCFLHDGMASHATHTSARVSTGLPVSLNPALVAGQACLVLQIDRFAAVLPKRDQPANAFSSAGGNVVAAGPVAVFTSLFLSFISSVE